jgi:copper oxidase (laccase) domain-containing protein
MTLKAMEKQYGCDIKDIVAGIGPSISAERYEVGSEVVAQVRNAFGDHSSRLLLGYNESMHFDLWEANRILLEETGVGNIEISGLCTAGNSADWYSHRGEKGKTGRFGVLIGLDEIVDKEPM